MLNPIDPDALRAQVQHASPFPFFCIDNFLEADVARRIATAYPNYEEACRIGHRYHGVNENHKVQISDPAHFAPPIAELNHMLASPEFCALLSHVFAIEHILPDEQLSGGGMHMTGARGHLGVHVDFNYIKERDLHRRLNLLIYLNPQWHDTWGGAIELWDSKVGRCHHAFLPVFNRCIAFVTSDTSFHGVSAVTCPPDISRNSFALYYYTHAAPPHWHGKSHSTIFKARPQEKLKKYLAMPLEKTARRLLAALRELR